jgi:hypothetical protein
MSIKVNVDEALVRAAQKATKIDDPETLVKAGLSLLASSSGDDLPDVEIYTDQRLAEFAQGEAELDEVLRRKGLR